MALVIVALNNLFNFYFKNNIKILKNTSLKYLIFLSLILTLIQVFTGTQVREFVDIQYELS